MLGNARTVARLKNPGLVAVYDQGLDARVQGRLQDRGEAGAVVDRDVLSDPTGVNPSFYLGDKIGLPPAKP